MEDRASYNSVTEQESLDVNELLPEQVIKNIKAIATHQERYRQNSPAHQQVIDKIVAIFGQPQFLYFQIVFFTSWGICSYLSNRHILPADFPLFDLREEGLEVAGLLISTGVLIYQNRQEKISEDRSHLMLQLNLITEQKIAKLISLVEELRTDLPNVINRADLEAEIMQQAIDPQAILEVIQQNSEYSPTTPVENENR
ncbi:MAG: DUF1003 domain-containing protein [Chamaesiphon sp.]|nr:DUF1003 domain-containing protein [Chamaesiphon sp.]